MITRMNKKAFKLYDCSCRVCKFYDWACYGLNQLWEYGSNAYAAFVNFATDAVSTISQVMNKTIKMALIKKQINKIQ